MIYSSDRFGSVFLLSVICNLNSSFPSWFYALIHIYRGEGASAFNARNYSRAMLPTNYYLEVKLHLLNSRYFHLNYLNLSHEIIFQYIIKAELIKLSSIVVKILLNYNLIFNIILYYIY